LFGSAQNLVESLNVIVNPEYGEHWRRVRELTGSGLEVLIALVSEYGKALAVSLADVYTKPFEIVAKNLGEPYEHTTVVMIHVTHAREL
jgi:hypothetical protein